MNDPTEEEKLSDTAEFILSKRYYKKGEDWKRLCERVASSIGEDDGQIEEFFNLLYHRIMIPNSPTLANAGIQAGQLAACFILPLEDDPDLIMDSIRNTAIVHRSGGGTGFDLSRIRPSTSPSLSANDLLSGPISIMKLINDTTEKIKRSGVRCGANMGVLRVDHPDIIDFIHAKAEDRSLTNFNISIAISDDFMDAVVSGGHYNVIDPYSGNVTRLDANEIFGMICSNAWKTGEPGVCFIDRINKDNPVPHLGIFSSPNPCGEFYFLPFGSCNLGSLSLPRFLKQDGEKKNIDFWKLREAVKLSVRFLNRVIDVNRFPLPEIDDMAKRTRPIGLGVMGFADLLTEMGIPYNSERAYKIAEELIRFINEEGWRESERLGAETGVFPEFRKENRIMNKHVHPRNCQVTTIAPTGTIATLAGISFGIEPLMAVAYRRRVLGADIFEVNPIFVRIAKERGFYSEELIEKISRVHSIQNIREIPEEVRRMFITAHDLTPEQHVRMQAAWQSHCDNAVSKTVNMPEDATTEDIKQVFLLAYRLNCKGVTVYRDRSRSDQVIVMAKGNEFGDMCRIC